eukprot:XP_025014999.1 long chain base biosynthesis protein 2a-like isoform X2 [Ricinus communis]
MQNHEFDYSGFVTLYNIILSCASCFDISWPISSAPDAWLDVVERYSDDNNKTPDEYYMPCVIEWLNRFCPSICNARVDGGLRQY